MILVFFPVSISVSRSIPENLDHIVLTSGNTRPLRFAHGGGLHGYHYVSIMIEQDIP